MRLAGIDAIGRGLSNLRANRELVLAQCLATVLLLGLSVLSLLPLFVALGMSLADFAGTAPEEALARLADPGLWLSPGVLAALGGGVVLGTVAIAVYSWFQAGIFGVLIAGDRQAGAGGRRPHELFRNFNWGDFAQWGRLRVWRFFAWYHLFVLVGMASMLLLALLLLAAVGVGLSQGLIAGLAVGCGGALPLFALLVLVGLVGEAAKGDLARQDSGAGASWRRGARVVGRRPGAALLMLLLWICASMGLSVFLVPLQLAGDFGLRDQPFAHISLEAIVFVLQVVLGALLGLAYGASWVALVRAELPDSAAAR
ncbi:MAG: hypothetical protein F9K16_08640 [Thermoanaerobaculia bacterium]|jgi:hypothetical protein|nr:MAG: hypothetical protein F9K16_08640 [Thermoanaerobaculia bacterium]MBZ0102446.1 hypothetical protein [Thermoanaerobaculia bacterium]